MSERFHPTHQSSYRLTGRVYFDNGRKSLPCSVCDIFYEGARITLSRRAEIPDVVELHVPEKHRFVQATVRWSHGKLLGLAFSDVGRMPPRRLRSGADS